MADDKRSQLKKYFKKFPKASIVLILLGLTSFPAGVDVFPALVLLAIGGWLIYSWSQQPTDEQVDRWVAEALQHVRKGALAKGGVDSSELVAETIVLFGPRFWDIGGADAGIKKGRDGILRFMPLGATVLNFTADQLLIYQCALDLASGNLLNESTDEYFYRDIVSVSTQSESLTPDRSVGATGLSGGLLKALTKREAVQFNSAEAFVLTTSAGTSVKAVLQDLTLIEKAGGGHIPTAAADKA